MNVENRLREALLLRRGDHQLGRLKPAITILTADFRLVDAASEGPPQRLGQSRDRQKHCQRVPMHEHQTSIRVYRADRGEGEDMVRTFQHPAPIADCLVLKVLKKAFMKAIGVQMSGLVEPMPVARDTIGRIEAQAREDVRSDLGAFLRRARVDRVHAAKIRREQTKQAQLASDLELRNVTTGSI